MKLHNTKDEVFFNRLAFVLLTLFSAFCLLPFILLVSGSFTEHEAIITNGFTLWPSKFSTEAYTMIFKNPNKLVRSYLVTISVTLVGTISGVLIQSMAAFVLSDKKFKMRNKVSFFFYFTSIFGGGLVPWYIFCIRTLHFKNNFLALILPTVVNVTYILILKSYMSSIPVSLYESARLDGAGDFFIYRRITMPMAKSGLATVALFMGLAYWNDWYNAMLFIDKEWMFPLQYYLNNILTKASAMRAAAARSGLSMSEVPSESMKLAMTVIATGPILLLYPFLQKFFVKGVAIGAVKG